MSGKYRPNSHKDVTHPKRAARQERAAKRLAAWEELTPEQRDERRKLNKEMYDARKVATQGRMTNGHSGS